MVKACFELQSKNIYILKNFTNELFSLCEIKQCSLGQCRLIFFWFIDLYLKLFEIQIVRQIDAHNLEILQNKLGFLAVKPEIWYYAQNTN